MKPVLLLIPIKFLLGYEDWFHDCFVWPSCGWKDSGLVDNIEVVNGCMCAKVRDYNINEWFYLCCCYWNSHNWDRD